VTVEDYAGRRGPQGLEVERRLAVTPCAAGAVTCARPGLAEAHRIQNDGPEVAITLHVYGRDLVDDPGAINIVIAP
jgi:hypothetical protein